MNSCLYDCRMMHHRLTPKRHRFEYATYMFYLDLDELDEISHQLKLFSRNHFNLFNFCDHDHLDYAGAPVKENILRYLQVNGVNCSGGRIMLLTNLRTLGHIFNPVSFYFCFDREARPICVVCEITNTFREMKPFFLGPEDLRKGGFHGQRIKHFYISPFVDLEVMMDFRLTIPGEQLNLAIDDVKDGQKFFVSTLTGNKCQLSDINLLKYALKIPFVTMQVITLIHWQAMLLYLKRIPYHRKEDRMDLQKEVRNVYKSNRN